MGGLAQMTVSWVRVPPAHSGNAAAQDCAKSAQEMVIRGINAAFRLMWLEAVPGVSRELMGKEMVAENLLEQAEWDKIAGLSSRCTHIYQWISNVLSNLTDKGYVGSYNHMVKMHVTMLAINNGALAALAIAKCEEDGYSFQKIMVLILLHLDLAFHHYLFQGLLDLHGALYNPNAGVYLGHLPALNFMDFVRDVTDHLVSENEAMPYALDLVDVSQDSKFAL